MTIETESTLPEPEPTVSSTGESRPSLWRAVLAGGRSFGTVAILIVLIVVFALSTDAFLTLRNVQNVLIVQTITALMTFGVMFPLIVGEFDLSVGYLIGFLAVLGAFLAGHGQGALVVIPAMILLGGVVGLINGLLTQKVGISSFIATLGVGIVLQGFTQGASGGKVLFNGIPSVVTKIGGGYAGPLAISVWIAIGFAIVLFYVLEQTPLGRSWYAVGGSERVSFLAGLRTARLKIAAFTVSGLMVGVASVLALGQSGSANPGFGPDLLLPAYAAAFLGVTTYRAGRYNVIGSVVGILLLAVGFNGLSLLGVPFWVQPIFNGGVLLVAVIVARAEARKVKVGT
ncbi:ABC transporter permease [Jatrophihabitans lederbergiae]|jgi:ribose transport system permease protein|uniref:ABC transporter permease n=1 Tax=Jatrophihabitans lederbergiae TaxID=3075547 RepID=A0ABU2JFW8_9ACTN|nr:ABC transporter permease [Jatrophihabitans sp. DSM 44399]MDT0263896.1 ABC transporter permease [Jatrophihabitans sp. DSM 44399]